MIHGKYHGNTGYLLRNVDAGTQEFTGMGYREDDRQMTSTEESQMMTSHWSHTSQPHTNESHKQIAQNKMTSRPRMEMMNDAFGCSRATQVHMEDLRLTENVSKTLSKAPCLVAKRMSPTLHLLLFAQSM